MSTNKMTDAQRSNAKAAADFAGSRIPNGPTAKVFTDASHGLNDDCLLAVHLIIDRHSRALAEAIKG